MAGRLPSLQRRVATLDVRVAKDPISAGFNDPTRGSTTARGYGWEWQKQRERVLKRDCYQCQECKRQGLLSAATQVDHIVAKADGGGDADVNLQSLCETCHDAKTQAENAGRRQPGVGRG